MRGPRVRLRLDGREPFAEGVSFGDSGPYERLWGAVKFQVDPDQAPYSNITDLALAPRNRQGLVEFESELYLLKPCDLALGNRRLLYEVPNRGTKLLLQLVNDAVADERPRSLAHAGNGYLMRRGYTLLWSAWQGDILPVDDRMTMQLPVPTHGGRPLTGRVRTEFAPGYSGTGYTAVQQMGEVNEIFSIPLSGNEYTRSYEAVSLDNSNATLTVREYETDERVAIPVDEWAFARVDDEGQVVPSKSECFVAEGFKRGWIYELVYEARDPAVLGLGFTGVRDLVSLLRHAAHDDHGTPNPLFDGARAGVECAYGWGCSQSARFLREFVYRGYNEDAHGHAVFEGINPFVSGAGRVALNYRFAQPGRYPRQHYDHLFPSDQFPFAYTELEDPLTGRVDAILKRPATDPYVIHTQTASEYWQRRGSLVHTDVEGRRLPDHEKARVYLFASAEHAADPVAGPGLAEARFPTNPLNVSALQRAVLDNLDAWVSEGVSPPESLVPMLEDGTGIDAKAVKEQFPSVPDVSPPSSPNRLFVQDHGPDFDRGVLGAGLPIEDRAHEYVLLVPSVDADGNDRPGIRGVELEAPIATYTGWNYRRRGEAECSMAAVHGAYLPFPRTHTERVSAGDERRSLEERYPTLDAYVEQVRRAALALVAKRLLLEEDAERFIERAKLGMRWTTL